MTERTLIEKRTYGYWPSLEFMTAASSSFLYQGRPSGTSRFSKRQKDRASTRDPWVILVTVNGAKGPFTEERTVTYGDWIPVDE